MRRRNEAATQKQSQHVPVDVGVPGAVATQRLQFRSEHEDTAEIGVVQRLLSESVARQPQYVLRLVPEAEREHSTAAVEGPDDAPLLDCREKDFRVAGATERMAQRNELCTQRAKVVDLAVEGDREAPADGAHRLRSERGEINNR